MDNSNMIWRDIPGFDGKYQVSRVGEVRHIWPSGHISPVKPFLKRNGRHNSRRMHLHLRMDGRDITTTLLSVMVKTWLWPAPEGKTWHLKNGFQYDVSLENIGLIDIGDLGRKTGGRSMRRAVEMVDADGNVAALYVSAREAARANNMSVDCVTHRCEGRIKRPFALNGYTFRWEEKRPARKRKKGV